MSFPTIRAARVALPMALVALALSACAPGPAGSGTSASGYDPCADALAQDGAELRPVADIESELGVTFATQPDCAIFNTTYLNTTMIWVTDDSAFLEPLTPQFEAAGYPDISVIEGDGNYFNGPLKVNVHFYSNTGDRSPVWQLHYPDPSTVS